MKIGIYDPYLDDIGGGEKYMMTIASCLAQQHDVSVFWDSAEVIAQIEKRFSLDLSNIKRKKNIFSKKVSFIDRLGISKQYDALIILSDGSIPFVLSNKLYIHFQQPLHITSLSRKTKIKLSRVTSILYNSEFTKRCNQKLFRQITSTVLYPPVPLFQKNVKKENIIIHVGKYRQMGDQLQDFKKQSVMIDNFKQMVDSGLKDWEFVIATGTTNENNSSFQKMIENTKGYPVRFLLNRSNRELWDMYNKAKIYWHASGYGEDLKKHPEYAEHFGISTVEAMGAGCVPVVINAGGQSEIITHEENGYLWDTLEQQRNFTLQLIHDKELLQSMSTHAKRRALDFSLDKFCDLVHKLIQNI